MGTAYLLLEKQPPKGQVLSYLDSVKDALGVPKEVSFDFKQNAADFDPGLAEFARSKNLAEYSALEIKSPEFTNWGAAQEGKVVANQIYNGSPFYAKGEKFYGAVVFEKKSGVGYNFYRGREEPYSRPGKTPFSER
ncbi:MAG: hypothetical protein V1820_06365 [archaeon]